jgi:hypothetical protein
MTEHQDKHSLRCETCNHHKIVGVIPDMYDECDMLDHTPTREERKFVERMGCASHSSITEHDAQIRNGILDELTSDLKTRFISSSNQWSKGRNSGLIECCNIIESLRNKEQP